MTLSVKQSRIAGKGTHVATMALQRTQTYDSVIERMRRDSSLNISAKLLMLYLIYLAGESEYVHMTTREIEQETQISSATLSGERGAIRQLRDAGYIRADLMPGATGHKSWLIYLHGTGRVDGYEAIFSRPGKPKETQVLHMAGKKITITVEDE